MRVYMYVAGIIIGLAHGVFIGLLIAQRTKSRRETE
jgi:uncharacterized protein YneF (UPF0154 family)